ncbi:PKD domain protein [Posidoniimonas corsicana]|uniref:PKD domain protein n=1 Tax=Posidoniimonas corsicana TaxID=1938618 RepID=A0A5C5UXX0_9BACT|nr:cadherin-like domain-containing protein [Posidoniimonas corsicana]TWT31101.1 PKD domain protein [Posidoniimonas corsicana]
MHRRTSRSLFANRPARRAARARTKAERISQRSQVRVYAMQRKRESRIQRWRKAFPTRFVPVNMTRFSALWAAVLSMFSDALAPPTFRRRASVGARHRVGSMRFFQPLEERVPLAADLVVGNFTFADVATDTDLSGDLTTGDIVNVTHTDSSAPATAEYNVDTFTSIGAAIAAAAADAVDNNGLTFDRIFVTDGTYAENISLAGSASLDGLQLIGDGSADTIISASGTIVDSAAEDVGISGFTLSATTSGATFFDDSSPMESLAVSTTAYEIVVLEDTPFTLTVDGSNVTSVTAGDTKGTVQATGPAITYTPNSAIEGPDTATFSFTTTNGLSGTVKVAIAPVNDAPTFALAGDQSAAEDSGLQEVENFLTGFDPIEAGQNLLTTTVTNNNNSLFSMQPAIDASGKLTYTPALDAVGTATVTVTVQDDGGTANGGVDSASLTFEIEITPVNDAPTEDINLGKTIDEGGFRWIRSSDLTYTDAEDDSTPENIVYEITSLSPGISLELVDGTTIGPAGGGFDQTYFTQQNLNNASGLQRVFVYHDGREGNSGLFTFIVRDSGDVDGSDPSSLESPDANSTTNGEFLLTVTPVNDAPVPKDDSFATDEDTTVGGNLLADNGNGIDSDPDAPADGAESDTLTVSEVEGVPIDDVANPMGTPVALASGATLLVWENGDFTLDPSTSASLNTLAAGASGSITFDYTLSDGIASNTASVTVDVTGVNDPLFKVRNQPLSVIEGGSAVITKALHLEYSDPDIGDTLTYTVDSIPAGTLTLAGVGPLGLMDTFTQADINAGKLTYTHNGDETTSDSFVFTVTDGSAASFTATFSVSVSPVNDNPEVSAPTGLEVEEAVETPLIGMGFGIVDPDSAPVTVTFAVGSGTIALSGTSALVADAASTPTSLVLVGSIGDIVAAWESGDVLYTSAANTPADTLTISVDDNDGGTIATDVATIDINEINDPPVVAGPASISVDEDVQTPIADAAFVVTDADTAIVTLTLEVDSGALNVTGTPAGVTVDSGDGTGMLVLSGSPTDLQAALVAGDISYTSVLNDDTDATLTLTVFDGDNTVDTTVDISIDPVDDALQLSTNDFTMDEESTFTLTSAQLSIVDPDRVPADIEIEITSLPTDASLLLNGTPLGLNDTFTYLQLLSGNVAIKDASQGGSTSFSFDVADGALPDQSGTINVTVTPINDAPEVTPAGPLMVAYTEGDNPGVLLAGGISLSDVDNLQLASATITITDFLAGDLLEVTPTGSVTVDASDDGTSGVLKLIGPADLADFEATIASITYRSTSTDPTDNINMQASRSITIQVDDGGSSDSASNVLPVTVDITPVNDAPVLDTDDMMPPATITYTENDPAVALIPNITVTDGDGPSVMMAYATVTLTAPTPGDVLSFDEMMLPAGFTVMDNITDTGTEIILTGAATAAEYQSFLSSVKFENTTDAPSTAQRTVEFVVNDGIVDSAPLSVMIDVIAENDPLVIEANEGLSILEGSHNADENYITTSVLNVTDADPEIDPADITYTLVSIKRADNSNGDDLVEIRNRIAGTPVGITSFTQQDINDTDASGPSNLHTGIQIYSLGVDATPGSDVAILEFAVTNGQGDDLIPNLTFTVNIARVNDAPSDGDGPGTVSVPEEVDTVGTPVSITDFTYTDEETPADELTIMITGVTPDIGVLSVNGVPFTGSALPITQAEIADNKLTFTHNDRGEGTGPVTVTYEVMDGELDGGALAATKTTGQSFTITIDPQNDSPIATDNEYSVTQSGTVSENLLTDDTGDGVDADPEGVGFVITEANGAAFVDGATISLTSGANVTLNADGSFTYDPAGAFDYLDDGATATDSFTYRIEDTSADNLSHPTISLATVTIAITGENDAPNVDPDQVLQFPEGVAPVSVVGLVTATDPDDSGTIVDFDIVGGDAGFEIDSTGQITTTADFDFEMSASPYTVLVSAKDDQGDWGPGIEVTLNLTDVNEAPTLMAPASINTLSEETAGTITGITVGDQDAGDTLTLTLDVDAGSLAVSGTPTGVTVSVGGATLTLTGSAADLQALLDASNGSVEYTGNIDVLMDILTVDLQDAAGLTAATEMVDLVLANVNDAPVADADPYEITVDKDSSFVLHVLESAMPAFGGEANLSSDADGDTISLTGVSATATGALVTADIGDLGSGGGTITYTANGSTGTDTFQYFLSDGTATTVVTVNVTVQDLEPVANDDDFIVTEGDTLVEFDVFADNGHGPDISGKTGQPSFVEVAGVPFTPGMVVILSGGTLTHVADGLFTYISDGNADPEILAETFTYTITDGTTAVPDNISDPATVTISVTDVPDIDPVISGFTVDSGTPGTEDVPMTFTVSASDGDAMADLEYTWNFGDGTVFTSGNATESHTYSDKGIYNVTVTVSDRGDSASATLVGVEVIDVTPPEIASVRVASLDWSSSFIDEVDATMGLGYSVADGEASLPWVNLDVIHVTFSEEVQKVGGGTITADDIQLIGVNSSPSIASFTYDNTTFTATITLFDPIGADKLLVYVDGADVQDDAGNAVNDGGSDSDSLQVNIVPGDANRSSQVSPTDLGFANGKKLLAVGDAGYSIYADVNGSGTVTGTDVNDIRLRQFSSLPTGSPMPPAPAPAAAPALTASPISDPINSEEVAGPAENEAPAPVLFVLSSSLPAGPAAGPAVLAEAEVSAYQDQSLLLYLDEVGSSAGDAETVAIGEDTEENETEEERDEAIGQLFGSAF